MVPRRDPAAQAVALPDGRLLLRHRGGVSVLGGVALEDLRRVLAEVDGRRTAGEIAAALAGEYEREQVLRLLDYLAGELLLPAEAREAPGPRAESTEALVAPIAILGGGPAARRLASRLALAGLSNISLVTAAKAPGGSRRGPGPGSPAEVPARGTALAIAALENAPYRKLFAFQAACRAAGVPALFLTADPDGVRLGPVALPDAGPCLACVHLAGLGGLGLAPADLLAAVGELRTGRLRGPAADRALAALAAEARALLDPEGEPSLLAEILLFPPDGTARRLPVERLPGCPVCGGAGAAGRGEKPPADFEALPGDLAASRAAPQTEPPRDKAEPHGGSLARRAGRILVESLDRRPPAAVPGSDGLVASVGILGGGTAGYLAALALRAKLPRLAVTLIESPDLPIIGVGEATTPLMPQFLHADLGLDVAELFREVRPTFKLGIRFLWGAPETGDFHYPFGPLHLLEPRAHGGDPRDCSLQGMLMTAGAVPVYGCEGRDGEPTSRLGTEVAYHLDNQRFVAYLQRRARERGVERLEATIAAVERSEDGEEVRAVLTQDGRRLSFDLYLDCTGFRSLLLEGALGSPWLSFGGSLFTDRAVVAPVPFAGGVRPYTTAETMRCGWCWGTPQEDADHRGYVFASAWLGDAEAEEEMRRANPGMGAARLVRFRAGRHAHFWKGNVAALGNAYGFVEPLESTALHMLIRQIGVLVQSFPVRRGERGLQALLDRKVGAWWDYLRWFLAIHYRFNRRVDSPFWCHCREEVDVGSHGELLAAFRERGPLSYDPAARTAFDYPDPLWGPEGIDALLLGQEVPAPLPRPALGAAAWAERLRLARGLVGRAVPHGRALTMLAERPDLLERFAAAFRAAGPAFPVGRG